MNLTGTVAAKEGAAADDGRTTYWCGGTGEAPEPYAYGPMAIRILAGDCTLEERRARFKEYYHSLPREPRASLAMQ